MLARRLTVSALFAVLASCSVAQTPAGTAGEPILQFSRITDESVLPNGVELRDGPMVLRITALRDDVIRLRASRIATLPEDASWAVLPAARSASVAVTQESNSATAGFRTASL